MTACGVLQLRLPPLALGKQSPCGKRQMCLNMLHPTLKFSPSARELLKLHQDTFHLICTDQMAPGDRSVQTRWLQVIGDFSCFKRALDGVIEGRMTRMAASAVTTAQTMDAIHIHLSTTVRACMQMTESEAKTKAYSNTNHVIIHSQTNG